MARRIPFEPILSQAFHHVSRCFFSKDASEGEDEEAYVDRLIVEYEEMFQKLGPSSVAAVMIEPVSGATLGAVPAARGYLARLRELCDKHGALLIYDEVMCGMGRLGTTHAWQSLGSVAPDLQTIGKGLSGGYQPVSAILVGPKVHQVMQATTISHPFVSGHTYQGHTIGCAAALATQQVMVNENLLTNVKAMGVLLERELRERTPMLKETRGLGLFVGVEFATQPDGPIAAHVVQTCLTKGAAIYLASPASDTVIFAPPFIINEREVKELVQIFVEATKQVLEGNDES
jgi:adenosylmethionine-8-amino-7-oxononanoate aminotransferase